MNQTPITPIPRPTDEIHHLTKISTLPPEQRIGVVNGDLLKARRFDAIVNAANAALTPGGGLSGAIHQAAGPRLQRFCEEIKRERGEVKSGHAYTTHGGNLDPVNIIHAVGAKWNGRQACVDTTWDAYTSTLEQANKYRFRVIAVPLLGAGLYGWPVDKAVETAILATVEGLQECAHPHRVAFMTNVDAHYRELDDYLRKLLNKDDLPLIPVRD